MIEALKQKLTDEAEKLRFELNVTLPNEIRKAVELGDLRENSEYKAALEKLGVWSSVEGKVAGAESVRAALALVSRGEAPYGIVYQTDAAADPGVAVVGTFPEDSHPPIIYPVAILSESKSAAAAAYLDFLKSDKAAPFFTEQGFTILK